MRHLLANKTDVTGDAQSPNSTSVVENFAAQVKARSRPALLLISSGILLIVAIGLFAGLTVYQLRERAVAKTERELSNTALILAEHSDRIFQSIELVEDSLVEQIQSLDIHSSDDLARYMSGRTVHLRLKDKLNGLPHASSLALIDADGKLINSSDDQPDFSVNVADHDYFTALKSDAHLNSFLSQTLRDVKDGTWKVFLAHRLVGADGEFLGIVVAGINLNHFRNFFTSISLGEHSWISLLRSNGVQLIRYPYDERTIGRAYPATIEALGTKTAARTRLISHNYGRARLVGLHRLTHYPLLVSIGMDTESVLADWREQAKALVIAAAFAAFVIVCVIFLITRDLLHGQRQSQQKLREQRLHLDTALNNMRQGLLMFDTQGRLILCNKRFLQMYGLESDAVKPGCTLSDLLRLRKAAGTFSGDPDQYMKKLISADGTFQGDPDRSMAKRFEQGKVEAKVMQLPDGRYVSITNQSMPGIGWVSTHDDITDRQQAEARIVHMAHHDALTDLPNRVLLRERLEQELSHVRRGSKLAVLYIDLDHFKSVNDTLGHSVGDDLLKLAAERLRRCVRDTDVIARLGGDEFAVVQTGLEHATEAAMLAQRLRDEITKTPFELEGHQIVVDFSIGVALAPSDGMDSDQLLRSADLALYGAKADGRGTCRFFEAEMDARVKARRILEVDLRKALANGEFELYYQPLINVEHRDISGCEALLRWHHPERGLISPAHFVPVAEETGLIVPIGEWVLRQACAEAATWPADVKVAVNLSPVQFKNQPLAQLVISALAASGLPSQRLELEITESALLHSSNTTIHMLHQLRDLGVRIAMDDFGTGYSSLKYLRSFPFDKIKIDRSFVKDLANEDGALAIVQAIISLANSLNMTTTAEGVETEQQLERLRAVGCVEMQGYLFSAPKRAPEITQLFARRAHKIASVA